MVSFPSRQYAELLKLNPVIINNFAFENESLSYENLKESLVCFNVFFNRLQYTEITESAKTSPLDLISSIGGQLGHIFFYK